MTLRRAVQLSVAGMALLALRPADADILVMQDGSRVETNGSWRVDGRRVLFTLPNGTLSSIRASEVDFDASENATARAAEAARQAAQPAAKAKVDSGEPVLRITEKDLPPMTASQLAGDESGEAAAADGEASTNSGVPLEVLSWDRLSMEDSNGVAVYGTLRNNGDGPIVAPRVTVLAYGEDGGLLATSEGRVNLSAVPAGKSANFRAEFPGLPDFAAVKFNLAGRGYEIAPETPAEPVEDYGDVADESYPDAIDDEIAPELPEGYEPVPENESGPPLA